MREILEAILVDADHPGGSAGKRVILQMKWGQQLMGEISKSPYENIYKLRAIVKTEDSPRPVAMMTYLNAEDIAMILAPEPESRIAVVSTTDISKFRPEFK